MAEVKWIKLTTDMFDNRKVRHLRRLPEGNNIVLIWVMLLTMAGRCNSGGMIFLTENIPYTPKMLADELDFEESTVRLALEALERLGMIVTAGEFFAIAGWEEHQNVEGMEKIREQTKKRVADYRARKKQELGVGDKCVYCGKYADTVDHIIPRSKGGADIEENIVPCCKSCNSSKKDKDLVDFLNDSFALLYQGVDHRLVRRNPKLMKYVVYDPFSMRYSSVTVTQPNATDIDIDKEEDIEGEIIIGESKPPKKKNFIPPTVEEVRDYCDERLNRVDPERFVDYYSSQGWKIGRNKMKDWKAAVRTWEKKEKEKPQTYTDKIKNRVSDVDNW